MMIITDPNGWIKRYRSLEVDWQGNRVFGFAGRPVSRGGRGKCNEVQLSLTTRVLGVVMAGWALAGAIRPGGPSARGRILTACADEHGTGARFTDAARRTGGLGFGLFGWIDPGIHGSLLDLGVAQATGAGCNEVQLLLTTRVWGS